MTKSHLYMFALLIMQGSAALGMSALKTQDKEVIAAATAGDLEQLRALKEAGANFNAVDTVYKANPLFWVIGSCTGETRRMCVRFLVEETSLDVNARNIKGSNALALAAHMDDFDTMRYLLSLPNFIVSTEENGCCIALVSALAKRQFDVATKLLESPERNKRVILDHSCFRMIAMLSPEERSKITTYSLDQELCDTIRFKPDVAQVRSLLTRGAQAQAQSRDHENSALFYAVIGEHQLIVKALLEAGASREEALLYARILQMRQGRSSMLSFITSLAPVSGSVDLFHAAELGDLTGVKTALSQGADVNGRDPRYGVMALHFAVQNGYEELVRYLVEEGGADVNVRSLGEGHVPLRVAVQHNREAIVRYLLSAGAKPDSVDNQGYTALHLAAKKGFIPLVRLLLSHGASVNARSSTKDTPLCNAAYHGHTKVVEILLEHGAEVDALTDGNQTALYIALAMDHLSIVKLLLQYKAQTNIINSEGIAPLHLATHNGKLAFVKALLEGGADVDLAADDGFTSLHNAAHKGNTSMVKLLLARGAQVDIGQPTPLQLAITSKKGECASCLLEHGADIKRPNSKGFLPIHIAAEVGSAALVELLLDHGASANEPSIGAGILPLQFAAQQGALEVVTLLLDRGALVDQKDEEHGCTALRFACQRGHYEVAQVLIKRGADIDLADLHNATPLHGAVDTGHEKIVQLLLASGAAVDCIMDSGATPLSYACARGNSRLVNILLDANASVNLAGLPGNTPLHAAVNADAADVVELLLAHNAEIDRFDEAGNTPLHVAAKAGNKKLAERLLLAGASVDAALAAEIEPSRRSIVVGPKVERNIGGERTIITRLDVTSNMTPLHTAAEEGHKELVELLLEHNADMTRKDAVGATPLFKAIEKGHIDCVECFFKAGASIADAKLNERSAFHRAAQLDDERMCNLLQKLYVKEKLCSRAQESYDRIFAALCSFNRISACELPRDMLVQIFSTDLARDVLYGASFHSSSTFFQDILRKTASLCGSTRAHDLLLHVVQECLDELYAHESGDHMTAAAYAQQSRHEELALLLTPGVEAAERMIKLWIDDEQAKKELAAEVQHCIACNKTDNLKRCGRCKRVYFCNVTCQRTAWPHHKKDCKA